MDKNRTNWHRLKGPAALAFRLSAAAALALWCSYRLGLSLPLWSVLTALIVTQVSLGRSLKVTLDYFAATLGGAIWGGFIAIAIPHPSESALLLVLMLALAPLAFMAALYPRMSVAPTTAAIVVLIPVMLRTTPLASAIDRISEVLVGGLAGLFVSFVLMPSSAFQHTRELAAHALESMARAVPRLIEGFVRGLGDAEAHNIQDGIGQKINELSAVIAEAERERPVRLGEDPLTGPLYRTLLRLRHDLVIIGRAAQAPLPAVLKPTLEPPLASIGKAANDHLRACAAALVSKRAAPAADALDSALADYTAEIDRLRRSGVLRPLPSEDVERYFASGFALEQMRRNLQDLDRCVNEWAKRRG
jgi:uncharacterized membrane protein YccC